MPRTDQHYHYFCTFSENRLIFLDPPKYDGLDETLIETDCDEADNCNNKRWTPWAKYPTQEKFHGSVLSEFPTVLWNSKKCIHCHATYSHGEFDGDEGCFDNAVQYAETHNDDQVKFQVLENVLKERFRLQAAP